VVGLKYNKKLSFFYYKNVTGDYMSLKSKILQAVKSLILTDSVLVVQNLKILKGPLPDAPLRFESAFQKFLKCISKKFRKIKKKQV